MSLGIGGVFCFKQSLKILLHLLLEAFSMPLHQCPILSQFGVVASRRNRAPQLRRKALHRLRRVLYSAALGAAVGTGVVTIAVALEEDYP